MTSLRAHLSGLGLAVLTTLAVLGLYAPAAQAQVIWAKVEDVINVEVVPGWRLDDGRHVAGLRFTLEPGWKTYWRSAGAAGIAPRLTWSRSRNLGSVQVAWPTPTVFRQDEYLSIGYDRDFILPLVLTPRRAGDDIRLRGNLDIGVCSDICLPANLRVDHTLTAGGSVDPALQAALDDRPPQISAPASCALRPTDSGLALTGNISLPPLGGSEAVVFEVPDQSIWVTDAVVQRSGNQLVATSELMVGGGGAVALDRSQVRITVIGHARAVEINGCTRP